MSGSRSTILVAALAAMACGASAAQAAPTVFAPAGYPNITDDDRAFLQLVDGWANRINTQDRAWNRCKTEPCARERVKRLSNAGLSAASNVRLALKHGDYPAGPPTTRCVRQVGAHFAQVATRAQKLDGFLFGPSAQARFDAAVRAYVAASKRAIRTAKSCRATLRRMPAPVVPLGTTRDRPFPIGAGHPTIDGWTLQVVGYTPDATAAVLAENQFNEPPPAGEVYAMARVRATWTGAGSATFGASYRLRVVGPSAVVRSTFDNSCHVEPDPLPETQVFTGGTVEGNVCWSVPAAEASSMVMLDAEGFGAAAQRFYALQ